jgi:hypothetical protein
MSFLNVFILLLTDNYKGDRHTLDSHEWYTGYSLQVFIFSTLTLIAFRLSEFMENNQRVSVNLITFSSSGLP